MRIIWEELKKIFRPSMLVILLFINFIMYQVFISFEIDYFPNGRPALDVYNISKQMVEKYGTELDEEELADFKQVYEEEKQKASDYLKASEEWAKHGVTDYEMFQSADLSETPKLEDLRNKLIFDDEVDLFWEIPERMGIIEQYENIDELYGYVDVGVGSETEKQAERIEEVVQSGAATSIFPDYPVGWNFHTFSNSVAITILLSVLLMLSPIFIRDEKNRMMGLQYASTTGRKLFILKAAAGFIAAFLIITGLMAVYGTVYWTNDIGDFLASGINSFMGSLYWYDLTFGGLILVTIALIYVICFSFTAFALFISSYCKNYITVIGVQLPVYLLAAIGITSGDLLGDGFQIWQSQPLLLFSYCLMILLPAVALSLEWRRVSRKDIV